MRSPKQKGFSPSALYARKYVYKDIYILEGGGVFNYLMLILNSNFFRQPLADLVVSRLAVKVKCSLVPADPWAVGRAAL